MKNCNWIRGIIALVLAFGILIAVIWVENAFEKMRQETAHWQLEYEQAENDKQELQQLTFALQAQRDSDLIIIEAQQNTIARQTTSLANERAEKQKALDALRLLPPEGQAVVYNDLTGDGPLAVLNPDGDVVSPMERIIRSNEIMLNEQYQAQEIVLQDSIINTQSEQIQIMSGVYENCVLELETAYRINSLTERQNILLKDEVESQKRKVRVWRAVAVLLGLAALLT